MARIRTIKPEFWTNEDLAELSEPACLLAIGLLNHADDEGFFKANVNLIKAAVFPIREPSVSVQNCLKELLDCGYLRLFEGADGKRYGEVLNFLRHQVINRPTKSKIKELDIGNDISCDTHGIVCEPSTQERKGREGKGKEQGKELSANHDHLPGELPVIELPTNKFNTTGETHKVYWQKIEEWKELYPAVFVEGELKKMKGWLTEQSSKRKTAKGMGKFIVSWLSRAQDRGGNNAPGPSGGGSHQQGDYSGEGWSRDFDPGTGDFEDLNRD